MTLEYIEVIKQFADGKISIKELTDFVDERLFNLRQNPESMTDEQKVLSHIELLLSEIEDGFRSGAELKEYITSLVCIESLILVFDKPDFISPITASSSNRNLIITSDVTPELVAVKDYYLQAAFV
jgi:hypothetical protein